MKLLPSFARGFSPVRILAAMSLALSLLFTSAAPAFALGGETGNLIGHVVDSATNAAIAGAVVEAVSPSGTYRAKTDAKGNFSILGLAVDTYTVSVQFQGFEPLATSGVTIIGDQDVNIGTLHLSKELVTIGRVTSRSVASAFQPNQTVDSVTISGARILQTTGRAGSTDEKALLLAAPGVTQTNGGSISIRGGLSTEVGYQFDGVPYTDPFQTLPATTAASVFSNAFNPSNVGSPLLFSGLSSVQVVEGAGDATQGNVGGGVVNLVPKRGTYPGFGSIDAAIGGPNFDHQLLLQYGFASANGRFSDYISFDGARDVPYLGYSNNELAGLGYFYTPSGVSEQTNDDLINNFVFKFGHNNDQSLQILYQSRQAQQYGFAGGLAGQVAYPFDPASYLNGQATSSIDKLATGYGCTGASGSSTCPYGPGIGMPAAIAEYQKLVGLTPNVPNTTNGAYTSPTLFQVNNTNYLKFEYDNSLTPNDYLAVRYYNWATNNVSNLDLPLSAGNAQPGSAPAGGSRAGMSGEFTHLFGTKHTFTFGFGYENQLPQYSVAFPTWAFADLSGAFAGPPGQGVPSFADFLQPVNGVCPIIGGCYLANYFPNGTPRVPLGGINYHGANFNAYNASLRDQWAPNSRLKFDYGLRLDGMAYNIKPNPVNAGLPFYSSDPTDVPTAGLNPQYYDPKALEPRLAVSYQMGANDAVRAGYGRSVIFLNAATFGTPAALYNAAPFENVPALDSAQNPQCGNSAGPGGVVKCLNYAQQLFWAIDNNFDYPDLGNATRYAVYNNYDFTYQHQFHNGWGLRLTPFYKLASDLPGVSVISLQTNPTTGEILSETFGTNNLNHNKTTGVELGLTTPERPSGFSGFLSMTYQNVLDGVSPLVSGEDSLPFDLSDALLLGDSFRAAYVSPFVARAGIEYKTKFGLRINPILNYIRGYPFSAGNLTPSYAPCGIVGNVPQVNFGCGLTVIPSAVNGSTASGSTSTQYVDPALPGNTFNPNIFATRGTPQTAAAGGVLSKPQLSADLDLEEKAGRNTVGVYIANLFGNVYNGSIPLLNPFYQPVATGIAGPQTGLNPFANPAYTNAGSVPAGTFLNHGNANIPASAYGYGPYIQVPVAPISFTFYYELAL